MPLSGPRQRSPRGSGDRLRDEILDAATELLLSSSDERLVSIRSVAQRVGVTPPSIYLHFADKDALLDAVCARYLEKLQARMQSAALGRPNALDSLRAQGHAYVRFAVENPELYRIATMADSRPGSDVDAVLASSAFTYLRASVQALMDEGTYAAGDPTMVTLELWTVAHGVAAMLISKPYLPIDDVEGFTDRLLSAVCYGQIATGLVGAGATQQQMLSWLFQPKGVSR